MAAQSLGIIGSIMAVGALHHFTGVHIPREMEIFSAGEIEERFRDILGGKNRPFGARQQMVFGDPAAQGVGGSSIIPGYGHRTFRRGGQAVTSTAIGGGGFGNPEPLAFQHPIRLESLSGKSYFAAVK